MTTHVPLLHPPYDHKDMCVVGGQLDGFKFPLVAFDMVFLYFYTHRDYNSINVHD